VAIDGYSHAYWGWGQEDDDLGARLRHLGVKIARPFPYPGPRPAAPTFVTDAPAGNVLPPAPIALRGDLPPPSAIATDVGRVYQLSLATSWDALGPRVQNGCR